MSERKRKRAEKPLPDVVPYNKLVTVITRDKHRHVDRAKAKFETVVLGYARTRGAATEREMRAKLKDWGKNGMPRNEVLWRRALWTENEYRHYREATAGTEKKRRAPWSDQRRKKMEASFAKQAKSRGRS